MGRERGFTLIEVLIVLAIAAFLATVVAPGYFGVRSRQVLNDMTLRVLADVRQTVERSKAQENGLQWGIRFWNPTGTDNDYYEIWSGTSYATGTVLARISLSPQLNFTDPTPNSSRDVIFAKATGLPNINTNVVISSSALVNQVGIVSVNTSGKIDYDLAQGLVGYFDMDENTGTIANDNSGNANNGSLLPTLTPPTWQTSSNCKSFSCLSFNGTTQYISIPDAPSLNPTSAITISAWVKAPDTVARGLVDKDRAASYDLHFNPNFRFMINNTLLDSTTAPNNTWQHVVATYDGSFMRIYVNGVLENSLAKTGAIGTVTTPLLIGKLTDGYFFNGSIDEVRIYSRALTSSEITSLYNFNFR